MAEALWLGRMASPLGDLLLVSDAAGRLRALDFCGYEARMLRLLRVQQGVEDLLPSVAPASVRLALEAYFAGDFAALAGIAWHCGGTAFQRLVWAALPGVPTGQTLSYGALAAQLGRPAAVRALGAANGANPLAIVLPCHRLVAADGALTGYAGGLERKRWLLRHEGGLRD